jgi:V/A-type H+-transporting ATPase subunit C
MSGLGTYAFLNARLRAKLSKLLSAEQYEQLMQAASPEGVFSILQQTEYRDVFESVVSAQDIPRAEAALVGKLITCHREVAAEAKGAVRRLVEELMRKYEVENLKVMLRAWNAKEEIEFIYRDRICNDIPVEPILAARTIEEIIVLLGETPYRKPLSRARQEYSETRSLFYLEVALDRELYEAMWRAIRVLSPADRKIASRLLGIEIDILNINWILRFKKYYNLGLANVIRLIVPGGLQVKEDLLRDAYPDRTPAALMSALLTGVYSGLPRPMEAEKEVEGLHLLEGLLRETYAQQLRNALGGYPFTIGTVIAYLRFKKIEVSNIITILNAKALQLPREDIERDVVHVK